MSASADTLERELELDRIAAALDAAVAGTGRTVIIEGPAGIGKSRLVADTRALAKLRRFGRLQATADQLESAIGWAVIRQMVDRSMLRFGRGDREALLAGVSGAALAALDGAPADAPASDAAVARTLHSLWWIAADLAASRPLLITVDDAQWADLPSLRFLVYLSRRISDLPIALVIATRPPPDASGPLAELCAGRDGERVLPSPLSQDAIAALSARSGTTPAREVVAAVHVASGGNPLLAGMLLAELAARKLRLDDPATAPLITRLGPSTISRALLARLPREAQALAGAASVLGARSDPSVAGEMVELHGARLASAIDALVAGHVVTADEEQLTFTHPVVREATLEQLGPGERAGLHAKAARALHATAAPVGRVAAHLAVAPLRTLPEAAAVLREAAARLLADGDAVTAAAHLRRALGETPHDQALQAELGFALLRAHDPAQAREHLRAAARAAPSAREHAERLAAAATATSRLDGPAAAVAELVATLDSWPEPEDDPSRLMLEARLAAIDSLLPDKSARSTRRLLRFARLPGRTADQRALLALLAQRARYEVHPAREVADLATRALGAGAYLDDAAHGADGILVWGVAVIALIATDAVAPAGAEIALGRTRIRERGSPLEFGIVSMIAAWHAWRTGDVAATETEARAALAALAAADRETTMIGACASATHAAVLTALEHGDQAVAADTLDTFAELCQDAPALFTVTRLGQARAMLALARDEPVQARQAAMALGDAMRATHHDIPTVSWRIPAALAALRLGDTEDARSLATEQLQLARRWGTATETGAALRMLARIDTDRRLDLLGEAITLLERSPARLELARALVDQGEALRVARRRKAAHEPLRRGAELAADCGARVLHTRAHDSLAALGDQPRTRMFSGQESLTASERRVAQLALDGRTNRDIAQELFVTPKTVENHLGRIYIKLGISSRRQLATGLR